MQKGQRLSDGLSRIEESIDQLNWYLYPLDVKRMLPMITVNSQKLVVVKCFGNISCSRETFKKVCGKSQNFR